MDLGDFPRPLDALEHPDGYDLCQMLRRPWECDRLLRRGTMPQMDHRHDIADHCERNLDVPFAVGTVVVFADVERTGRDASLDGHQLLLVVHDWCPLFDHFTDDRQGRTAHDVSLLFLCY